MVLKALRCFTLLYAWIWTLSYCCIIVSVCVCVCLLFEKGLVVAAFSLQFSLIRNRGLTPFRIKPQHRCLSHCQVLDLITSSLASPSVSIKFFLSLTPQITDNFTGIAGIKRRRQFEFLLLAAFAFVCFQFVIKSLMYFLLTSLWSENARRRKVKIENASKEIELISSGSFNTRL
jgi:hypothetical protein